MAAGVSVVLLPLQAPVPCGTMDPICWSSFSKKAPFTPDGTHSDVKTGSKKAVTKSVKRDCKSLQRATKSGSLMQVTRTTMRVSLCKAVCFPDQ